MRTVTALASLLALSAPAYATIAQSQVATAAGTSLAATQAGTPEEASAKAGMALGENPGVTPVPVGAQSAATKRATGGAAVVPSKMGTLSVNEPPTPHPSVLHKAGDTLKGWADDTGAFLKKHAPEIGGAAIGAGAGVFAAHVAGMGLLGAGLAGAGIGVAAVLLAQHDQPGPAIGAACFGLAGLALGGPIGGLLGALIGGGGAWLLGKAFYS